MMEIELLNCGLLSALHEKAVNNVRLRQNYDLRTTSEDGSQRMLNVLQPGTKVAVHRHLKTSETANMDAGGPINDGETAADESCFKEVARFRICPREGQFGIQIPKGAWHSIEVHEPSAIFEAKDGGGMGSDIVLVGIGHDCEWRVSGVIGHRPKWEEMIHTLIGAMLWVIRC